MGRRPTRGGRVRLTGAAGQQSLAMTKWNPHIWRFYEMKHVSSKLQEDEDGGLSLVQVRRDPKTGTRQKLTMKLDKPTMGD